MVALAGLEESAQDDQIGVSGVAGQRGRRCHSGHVVLQHCPVQSVRGGDFGMAVGKEPGEASECAFFDAYRAEGFSCDQPECEERLTASFSQGWMIPSKRIWCGLCGCGIPKAAARHMSRANSLSAFVPSSRS